MKKSIKFNNNNNNSLFSNSLKSRVNDYFKMSSKDKSGGLSIKLKAVILLALLLVLYLILVFIQPHFIISIFLCILLGQNLATIGFNIMHDAGHNTFSTNVKLNNVLSYSLNLMGGNIFFWKLKHNIAHHTYTNIEGEDHDIEIKFMRIHPDQELKKFHRFQRYYFILLYSVSYLAWIFFQDYEKYFRGSLAKNSPTYRFPVREKVTFG